MAEKYDRPSIMDSVCEQIANGKSLRVICDKDNHPAPSTIISWLAEDRELAERYAHARERQADFYADEVVEIADKASDAQLARLQVDARKWAASKLAPKKYGDKLAHVGGDESDNPIQHQVTGIEWTVVNPKP